MKITIKEIADMSGVGIATVSRVINNSGYVSEQTRQKVMEVINHYNYKPNNINDKLKTNLTTVGVFVKGIGNPFFQKITRELERELTLRGCSVIFYDVLHLNEIVTAGREMQENNIDGAIILGGSNVYEQEQLEVFDGMVVLLTVEAGENVPPEIYSSVTVDDIKEGYKATQSLIDLGHEKIGFIYLDKYAENTPNYKRFLGYKQALEANGLACDSKLIAGSSIYSKSLATEINGYRVGFNMMQELLRTCPDMTAVFAYSDTLALGAAKYALVSGLKIPDDMSIVGFDGIDEVEFFHPSIDTVSQPIKAMCNAATTLLIEAMNGKTGQHKVLDCDLLNRGSSRGLER